MLRNRLGELKRRNEDWTAIIGHSRRVGNSNSSSAGDSQSDTSRWHGASSVATTASDMKTSNDGHKASQSSKQLAHAATWSPSLAAESRSSTPQVARTESCSLEQQQQHQSQHDHQNQHRQSVEPRRLHGLNARPMVRMASQPSLIPRTVAEGHSPIHQPQPQVQVQPPVEPTSQDGQMKISDLVQKWNQPSRPHQSHSIEAIRPPRNGYRGISFFPDAPASKEQRRQSPMRSTAQPAQASHGSKRSVSPSAPSHAVPLQAQQRDVGQPLLGVMSSLVSPPHSPQLHARAALNQPQQGLSLVFGAPTLKLAPCGVSAAAAPPPPQVGLTPPLLDPPKIDFKAPVFFEMSVRQWSPRCASPRATFNQRAVGGISPSMIGASMTRLCTPPKPRPVDFAYT